MTPCNCSTGCGTCPLLSIDLFRKSIVLPQSGQPRRHNISAQIPPPHAFRWPETACNARRLTQLLYILYLLLCERVRSCFHTPRDIYIFQIRENNHLLNMQHSKRHDSQTGLGFKTANDTLSNSFTLLLEPFNAAVFVVIALATAGRKENIQHSKYRIQNIFQNDM